MSEPTYIGTSSDLVEANQISKRKKYFVEPLMLLCRNPFVDYIMVFVQGRVTSVSKWYLILFITSFTICIYIKTKYPVTEQDTVLNSLPSGSGLRKIQDK